MLRMKKITLAPPQAARTCLWQHYSCNAIGSRESVCSVWQLDLDPATQSMWPCLTFNLSQGHITKHHACLSVFFGYLLNCSCALSAGPVDLIWQTSAHRILGYILRHTQVSSHVSIARCACTFACLTFHLYLVCLTLGNQMLQILDVEPVPLPGRVVGPVH